MNKCLRVYGTSIRINNLELRNNTSLVSSPDKLEIVCWQPTEIENHQTCFTVCQFVGNTEDGFDIRSVRDRIFHLDVDADTLNSLIKIGFKILEEVDELC
jgi:hypothetical protein